MIIVYSPLCLNYCSPGHPESPDRVGRSYEYLKKQAFKFIAPKSASKKDLLLAHSKEHIQRVKSGAFTDPDTPYLPTVFKNALLSVGAAIQASQIALGGEHSFSLMRPPGHHAGRDSTEGFCYFNNIAVAAIKLAEQGNRVAIVDIDAHHGNGTEEIVCGNKRILYISLHQTGIYPGTGVQSNGNIYNLPMYARTTGDAYLRKLDQALYIVKEYNPDIIGVSAGFDTYKDDPLANMRLDICDYKTIGSKLFKIGAPTFSVLEGGYSAGMHKCIYSFLVGIKGD